MPRESFVLQLPGYRSCSGLPERDCSARKDDRPRRAENLQIRITYVIPPIHESVVIEAANLDPAIEAPQRHRLPEHALCERRSTVSTLDTGINAGQHEGGGKSSEIRRFGFNLDHGGVNGGLKVLVDDVQQKVGSQFLGRQPN